MDAGSKYFLNKNKNKQQLSIVLLQPLNKNNRKTLGLGLTFESVCCNSSWWLSWLRQQFVNIFIDDTANVLGVLLQFSSFVWWYLHVFNKPCQQSARRVLTQQLELIHLRAVSAAWWVDILWRRRPIVRNAPPENIKSAQVRYGAHLVPRGNIRLWVQAHVP